MNRVQMGYRILNTPPSVYRGHMGLFRWQYDRLRRADLIRNVLDIERFRGWPCPTELFRYLPVLIGPDQGKFLP